MEDPLSQAELLAQLRVELLPFVPMLSTAVEKILASGYTKYPIFVFSKEMVKIGINILDTKTKDEWKIYVSSLEEFLNKAIIDEQRMDDFQGKYNQLEGQICLFVLSELGANFIFFNQK
ncbi:MAG: hypothetical protein IPQ04_13995 [Saprospiraceae bacterium]|jgi:hypothetical protein|nr:hypothetical protein [Saprospiraceae bacterium]